MRKSYLALAIALFAVPIILGASRLTDWDPIGWYTAMSYGVEPTSRVITRSVPGPIYSVATWCADDDTFGESTNHNNTQLFHNTNLSCNAQINGGTLLGQTSSYDSSTNKTTITFTVQAPELAETGYQWVLYDKFTWTDGGTSPVKDTAVQCSSTVVWRYRPDQQSEEG